MTDEKIIARMQADQEQGWPLCPRCGERMPDKLTHGLQPMRHKRDKHRSGIEKEISQKCTDAANNESGKRVKQDAGRADHHIV